jgi:hypothetical protein
VLQKELEGHATRTPPASLMRAVTSLGNSLDAMLDFPGWTPA